MRTAIYARVSTDRGEQDPAVQVEALTAWLRARGDEPARTFTDCVSGTKRSRPELDRLLQEVDAGAFDAVAVVKLDRLARSTRDLIEIAGALEAAGVELLVKDQAIDTSTPSGKLLFHVLAAVAEFERDLIVERTRAGLAHARARGVAIGRPRRDLDRAAVRGALRDSRGNVSAAARRLGVPRSTLARAVARGSVR